MNYNLRVHAVILRIFIALTQLLCEVYQKKKNSPIIILIRMCSCVYSKPEKSLSQVFSAIKKYECISYYKMKWFHEQIYGDIICNWNWKDIIMSFNWSSWKIIFVSNEKIFSCSSKADASKWVEVEISWTDLASVFFFTSLLFYLRSILHLR